MSRIAGIVGGRIRTLRCARGLSQEQLALKADLNTSYMGQIERGEKSPTIDSLDKIVNALGISFEELFKLDNYIVADSNTMVLDKIIFLLNGRTDMELEYIYDILKQIFSLKDSR